MTGDPTPLTLLQGLILLVLMWWAWSAYTWLGNQARADVGLALAVGTVAMAATFVVGLLIPDAWHDAPGGLDGPLTLALAYTVVRVLYLSTYLKAASGDRMLRHRLMTSSIPTAVAWVPFIVGGTAQVWLWTATFVIDFGGGAVFSRYGGFRVRSPGYFAERHGLVVIIALGESLAAVGAGVGAVPVTAAILGAALLGFAAAVCLWLLYFRAAAPAAERRLAQLEGRERAWLARDVSRPDGSHALGWVPLIALYGGAAVYLAGRTAILRRAGAVISRTRLAMVGIAVVLIPVAHALTALAALGLITVALAVMAAVDYRRRHAALDDPRTA